LSVVKRKLAAKVNENEMLDRGLLKEKSFGDDYKEDLAKKYPSDDVEGLLNSLGLLDKDNRPKLTEQDIKDPEIFY
jgi:hypothetical protein